MFMFRNPLCAGEEARKRGIHPGFETQGRHHHKFKTGVSVAPRKWFMSPPSKIKKKVLSWMFFLFELGDWDGISFLGFITFLSRLLSAVAS